MQSVAPARLSAPPAKLACAACTFVSEDPITNGCGHSFCKKCARRDESKNIALCPSCKILESVSVVQSDEEVTERVKNYLVASSTSSSTSIQYDSGLDLMEDDAPPPSEYLRYIELNAGFVKIGLTTSPPAAGEKLFAVLKNICSAYLLHTKECLMALDALATIPRSDSLLSSCMAFLSSSNWDTTAFSQSSRLVTPISYLTQRAESRLLQIAMRLMDTVEICLKTLEYISSEALRLNKHSCDDLLNVLCDNLRSFGYDSLVYAEGDQRPQKSKTSMPLEIRDPATNRLLDLHRFGRNEAEDHVRKSEPLVITPVETGVTSPNQDLNRMSESAPTTPKLANGPDKRTVLEIRDPNTNQLIKLPSGISSNSQKLERPNGTKSLPVAIIDPKTNKPINLPKNSK